MADRGSTQREDLLRTLREKIQSFGEERKPIFGQAYSCHGYSGSWTWNTGVCLRPVELEENATAELSEHCLLQAEDTEQDRTLRMHGSLDSASAVRICPGSAKASPISACSLNTQTICWYASAPPRLASLPKSRYFIIQIPIQDIVQIVSLPSPTDSIRLALVLSIHDHGVVLLLS